MLAHLLCCVPLIPMTHPNSSSAPAGLDLLRRLAGAQAIDIACDHFFFLRHGQTECNAQRIFQAVGEPLNATGLEQARRAATVLATAAISSIVCSDVRRARDTAELVAARHLLAPIINTGLRERNFGKLIGTSSRNIDWACVPEAGETLEEFVARSGTGLAEALTRPAPTLVVAHGGTLHVLAGLLGIRPDESLFGNAEPLRFERHAGAWQAMPLAPATGGGANLA